MRRPFTPRTRLFLIIWLAGFVGVLSFLTFDLAALIAVIPIPDGAASDLPSPALLKLISLVQPTILVTLSAIAGSFLASAVGLHAPAAEAIANREPVWPALKPQLLPGIVAGVVSGVVIIVIWVISKPFLGTEFLTRAQELNRLMPYAVRMLYGGFTEEILLRWGLMTLLVWILWRVIEPKPIYVISSIFISALLFGVGHLPIASLLAGGLTLPLVAYVVAANSFFGVVAGFLYWRRGLEAAIIAHMFVHVVLVIAISLAL